MLNNDTYQGFEYLAIVAAPNAVPMAKQVTESGLDEFVAADSNDYADLNGDGFRELAVGRIFGVTVADVSGYVARVVHYAQVASLELLKKSLFIAGAPLDPMENMGNAEFVGALSDIFALVGAEVSTKVLGPNQTTAPADWTDKGLIVYCGHGFPTGASIDSSELPSLSYPIVVAESCQTGAWDNTPWNDKGLLFAATVLRKGAVGFIGAVDDVGFLGVWRFLDRLFGDGATLGSSFMHLKNIQSSCALSGGATGDPHYLLFGDPVFKPARPVSFPKATVEHLGPGLTYKMYGMNFFYKGADGESLVLSTLPMRGHNGTLELRLGQFVPLSVHEAQVTTQEGNSNTMEIGRNVEFANVEIGQDKTHWWIHVPTSLTHLGEIVLDGKMKSVDLYVKLE